MNPEIEKRIKLVQAGKVPSGYKLSKVGVIPNEWSLTYLKDVAIHVTEKNKDNAISLTLTNSATKGVIKQTEYFDKQISNKENTDGYFVVQNGDYIYNPRISESAPCGPINRSHLGESGIASPLYTVFRMNSDIHNECYIEMFLKSPFWHRYMCGVANYGARHDRMNITNDDLFSMPLPVPPKREQEKIAEILAAQDRVIELKEKLIAEKQRRKHSLVDFYLNYKNCKEIPLNEICVLNDTCVKKENEEKSFYYLDIASVNNGRIDIPQNKQKIKDAPVRARRLIKKYDVLMSTVRPYLHAFAFIDFDAQEFVASTGFAVLSFKSKFDSYLVYHQLFSRKLDKQYEALLVGGNYPALNSKDIENLLVFIPSQEEKKEKIYNLLSAADEEITLLQKDLEQEKLKKKSLMQLLLTGLVRVSA